MKKIIISLVALFLIMLSFSSTVKADTYTVYVVFHFNNTCNSSYTGNYYVKWSATAAQVAIGSVQQSIAVKEGTCLPYQLTIDPLVSDKVYGVEVQDVAEYPSLSCPNTTVQYSPYFWWNDMLSNCTVTITINL